MASMSGGGWPIANTGTRDDASDPREVTELAGEKLYGEISRGLQGLPVESWMPLQGKLSAISREANGAVNRLPKHRENLLIPREGRTAAFDEDLRTTKETVDGLHKEALALTHVLKAELVMGSRPKVNAEREAFVRQDVASLLEGAGADALRRIMDIARGSHRDRAAVVLSDFGDVYLQRALPSKSQREAFLEGLNTAALDGAIEHGTPDERKYAQAAKVLTPKVSAWLATRVVPAKSRLRDVEATRP